MNADTVIVTGTRTDLVATYSVIKVLPSFSKPGGGRVDRARPKSHNCQGETTRRDDILGKRGRASGST